MHDLIFIIEILVPFVEVEEAFPPESGLSLEILNHLWGDIFIGLLLVVLRWVLVVAFLSGRVLILSLLELLLLHGHLLLLLLFHPESMPLFGRKLIDVLVLLVFMFDALRVVLLLLKFGL